MLDVKNYAESQSIPYRYFQFDSWWYYKGAGNGVKEWEPRPDIFPHGSKALVQKLGLPIALHNRFCLRTRYMLYRTKEGICFRLIRMEQSQLPSLRISGIIC